MHGWSMRHGCIAAIEAVRGQSASLETEGGCGRFWTSWNSLRFFRFSNRSPNTGSSARMVLKAAREGVAACTAPSHSCSHHKSNALPRAPTTRGFESREYTRIRRSCTIEIVSCCRRLLTGYLTLCWGCDFTKSLR